MRPESRWLIALFSQKGMKYKLKFAFWRRIDNFTIKRLMHFREDNCGYTLEQIEILEIQESSSHYKKPGIILHGVDTTGVKHFQNANLLYN